MITHCLAKDPEKRSPRTETAQGSIKEKPAGIQAQIDTLERTILEHRRPADELTEELRAYLERDELRFAVAGTGYALTRNGRPVSHLRRGRAHGECRGGRHRERRARRPRGAAPADWPV